jgi:hypothetical protein
MIFSKNANLSLSGIFFSILKDIFFFPFWWYSFGLVKIAKKLVDFLIDRQKSLALFVWVKNIFVPMYGQRDIQGFIISFFIRLVQIIFRGLSLAFWIILSLLVFWVWILFPVLVTYEIIWQIL